MKFLSLTKHAIKHLFLKRLPYINYFLSQGSFLQVSTNKLQKDVIRWHFISRNEVEDISTLLFQKYFNDLNDAKGIDLENIVYYKDETHYFVMTAKKQSLLEKGVIIKV